MSCFVYLIDFANLGLHFSEEVFSLFPQCNQINLRINTFPASEKAGKSIEQWLQNALGSSSNISKLAGTIDNDDDPRIRPMTKNEMVAIRQYLENETEILSMKGDIEVGRKHVAVILHGENLSSDLPRNSSVL